MNIAHYISNWWKEVLEYKERVLKDGGTTKREDNVQRYYQMCKEQGILNSIKFAWLGEAGYKQRTSGINTFWTKLFSIKTTTPQARRNLLTYTEEFDNAVWSKTRSNVTGNVILAPNGTNTADKLIEDATASDNHYLPTTVTTLAATTTFSCYAKAAERNWMWISMRDSGNNARVGYFNISSGVVGTAGAGLTVSISSVGNGWHRCIATIATAYGGVSPVVIGIATSNNSQVYNGDGTSGIYIWGAQLEVGSSASTYQRVIDANSWDGVVIDATQTTSTSQPYLSGNIAPTEKLCLKNNNGDSRYMTHSTISFAANEAWSVTTVVNWNKQNNASESRISSNILLDANANGTLRFSFGGFIAQVAANTLCRYIGKNAIITTICKNGAVEFYINGISIPVASYSGTYVGAEFKNINYSSIATSVAGTISAHIIRAQALTPSQVAAEANFLRSLYPEIPSVTIGTQTWATSNCEMVATPQGNLIQNVTENANVEKITNAADREFSSDTGFWSKDTGITISDNACHFTNVALNSTLRKIGLTTSGKWHKITYTISNYSSGLIRAVFNASVGTIRNTNGTFIDYLYADNANPSFICGANTTLDVDNVSIQEIGWAGSTELFDGIYAQTAGTDEQKTYAAVKAAAMWCYYNNDVAIGSVYGKILNDYAIKLMDMDIAYYNIANPTTPWGYGIPTEAEWNTLETTINNDAEALKHAGTTYWTAPNAGTNSTGFTALPAGYRKEDGTFAGLNTTALFGSTDMSVPRIGKSLRLIKR